MPGHDESFQLISEIRAMLKQARLSHLSGKVLYSGINTLKTGDIYVLGYNTGGDPGVERDSLDDNLDMLLKANGDWNAYLDESWRPGGRLCQPGQAPMQCRVKALIEGIGLKVRQTCASNLIFVRSRAARSLSDADEFLHKCWEVHRLILKFVRPTTFLYIGGGIESLAKIGEWTYVGRFPSGHANWLCNFGRLRIERDIFSVVALPHLSRYAVDHHPDVMDWIRKTVFPNRL